jgi:hypothetical protein
MSLSQLRQYAPKCGMKRRAAAMYQHQWTAIAMYLVIHADTVNGRVAGSVGHKKYLQLNLANYYKGWYHFIERLFKKKNDMKKVLFLLAFLPFEMVSINYAQVVQKTETTAKKAGHEVKKDAKKAGNKTAEVAVKAESKIVDKEVADKMGPNGEKVYMKKNNRYYYVTDKGKKVYIKKAELKERM